MQPPVVQASVAQSAARQSHNLKVVSSSLTGSNRFALHDLVDSNQSFILIYSGKGGSRETKALEDWWCSTFSMISFVFN